MAKAAAAHSARAWRLTLERTFDLQGSAFKEQSPANSSRQDQHAFSRLFVPFPRTLRGASGHPAIRRRRALRVVSAKENLELR